MTPKLTLILDKLDTIIAILTSFAAAPPPPARTSISSSNPTTTSAAPSAASSSHLPPPTTTPLPATLPIHHPLPSHKPTTLAPRINLPIFDGYDPVMWLAQLPFLPPEQYLGMFFGGLQPTMRDKIPNSDCSYGFAAICATRRIAHASKTPSLQQKPAFSPETFNRPLSASQQPLPNPEPPPKFEGSQTGSHGQFPDFTLEDKAFRRGE